MNLPQLPVDKANHAIYGLAIFIVCALACVLLGHPRHACLIAIYVVLAAGCAKEVSDWLTNRRLAKQGRPPTHDVDVLDIAATAFGGLLGVAAFAIGDAIAFAAR